MPYGGYVADVLGVANELGAVGYVVATFMGWYLEFCEKFVKPLATSSPTMSLVNLACSENIAEISSRVTEVDESDTFSLYTSFVKSIGGRMGCLICVTEPR
jgi:hypothetical protein